MLDQGQVQRRKRAIVSDDDEFFRVAMASVLRQRNGFSEVIETGSFDEAVDRLGTAGKVDIGFFDLNMVGMENWLDLSAARKEFPDMLLVVVSASRRREDILRSLEIGAHGYIHKGQGVTELSRAVEHICEGQVYVPPFLPDQAVGAAPIDYVLTSPHAPSRNGGPATGAPQAQGDATFTLPMPEPLRCSPRQREIIELLIAGKSNKGMARALNLSEGTIKFHMSAVMRLLGVNSRVEAATRAMKHLSA